MANQFHDHLGRKLELAGKPQRIISLCPSITETLFALGLGERLVGRTRFCIHPGEQVGSVHRVGGTKEIKMDRLHSLKPDLIIAEKEENTPGMVAELEKDYPVFVADVESVEDALKMIEDLGKITDTEEQATMLLKEIKDARLKAGIKKAGTRVAYFIWKDPYMAVGKNTYIQSIMDELGWQNILLPLQGRYPVLQPQQTEELQQPEWVLLSSEPYPFGEKHFDEFQSLFPSARIQLVDGEMFSWYGSRMVEAFSYLARLQEDMLAVQGQ